MVFNRPVRDALIAHRRSFAPEWQQKADILEKRARRAKELQIEHYNRTAHPFQPFKVGNHMIVQHPISKQWATPAIVTEVGPNRDYIVKTPAPTQSPLPEENPATTTRRRRGKAKTYFDDAPRRSTHKTKPPEGFPK